MSPELDQKSVAIVKALVMDAVRQANSGHPGGPMSSADFATILFKDYLRFDPDDPDWFNRDRFILSPGHESSLLYALLHLRGWLGIKDLQEFRQWGSRTPGHPEVGVTPGVEATTGPLGQGLAMAVGFAAAEAHLRATLGAKVCDHHTYVLASDGDMQEDVALGACALAGLWRLSKLIVFYDANAIQLAGPTSRCDCADHRKIFEGLCWQVVEIDGHDHAAIRKAMAQAHLSEKPTLILGRTVMAKGAATLEGSHKTHGEPLKAEEIAATKSKWGLPADASFYVPAEVVNHYQARFPRLREVVAGWKTDLSAALDQDAHLAERWTWVRRNRASLAFDWPRLTPGDKLATRQAWGLGLGALVEQLPTLVGGSADLDPSNQTEKFRNAVGIFGCEGHDKRNLSFGVREFPMGAILNGIALHGGLVPFGATFLSFADYMRGALRLSALQHLPVLAVFTHDSFYVGEDGPTHQPIEHIAALRLIPNMLVLRPADAQETFACLEVALRQDQRPCCLLLTRQALPILDPAVHPGLAQGPAKGGYILQDCAGTPEVVILATGSEVHLALGAAKALAPRPVRVVSLPCMELFDAQPAAYKAAVIPAQARLKVGVEAGRSDAWYKYVGPDGLILGLDHFGASAPAQVLAERYGFTVDNLTRLIRQRLQGDA